MIIIGGGSVCGIPAAAAAAVAVFVVVVVVVVVDVVVVVVVVEVTFLSVWFSFIVASVRDGCCGIFRLLV